MTFSISGAFLNLVLFVISAIDQYTLFSLFKSTIFFIVPAIITIISIARKKFNLLAIPFTVSGLSVPFYQEQVRNISFYYLIITTLTLYFISTLLEAFLEKKT